MAIIVSGSVVRNEGSKNSDLDIYVIHNDNFRQRITKYFNGVPCDLFINNIVHINNYFIKEHINNRPVTADMIATGNVVYGSDNQYVIDVIERAKIEAKSALTLSSEEVKIKKYELLTILEDVEDVIENDLGLANYILQNLMLKTIDFTFLRLNTPIPRAKNRLKVLIAKDAKLGQKIRNFYTHQNVTGQYEICKELINVLLESEKDSTIEWETKKEF